MALSIVTRPNTLPSCKAAYIFFSVPAHVVSERELIRETEKIYHLQPGEVDRAVMSLKEQICFLLGNGCKVVTPFGTFSISANGYADTDMEKFTPGTGNKKHQLNLHFLVDRDMKKKVLENVKWTREERFDNLYPVISSVSTVYGEKGVCQAEPGDCLQIKGRRLHFDAGDTDTGIFFWGKDEVAIRSDFYAATESQLVIAHIPKDLPEGMYKIGITIRTRSGIRKNCFTEEYRISRK